MQWTDHGVVLGVRKHGESNVILETITAERGRHLGLVRGGRGKRHQATLQPGNSVALTWNARIEEQLGLFTVEADGMRAARLMEQAAALYGLGYLCALLRMLPEREPQPGLYAATLVVLDHLDQPAIAAPLLVRLELEVLNALGFGLDLTTCAATGVREGLVYVSPRSGRAVSAESGKPYHDRLLPLPAFAQGGGPAERAADLSAIQSGFRLTGYFLERDVFGPRGQVLPDQRAAFLRELGGAAGV